MRDCEAAASLEMATSCLEMPYGLKLLLRNLEIPAALNEIHHPYDKYAPQGFYAVAHFKLTE